MPANTSPRRMPSIQRIRAARPELGYYDNMTDDEPHCWACGAVGLGVKRAHILPRWRGGNDAPDNFFLLCPPCYGEQDAWDAMPVAWQWAWLSTHEAQITRHLRMAAYFIDAGITTPEDYKAYMMEVAP